MWRLPIKSLFRPNLFNETRFFSSIIKPPPNPTMAESFGSKIPKADLEKLMNPTGFLDEKDYKDYEGINKEGQVEKEKEAKAETSTKTDKNNNKFQEYGFKVKGPEPTRYGDWERKGRVSDF